MKGRVPPELLQQIKEKVNLIELIGEYVVLRKSGSNYSGLCPFHSERSPSFSVSETKQFYHCFGCKRGGDSVAFLQEMHGLSFPEAIEELAERARIPLPDNLSELHSADADPEVQKKRAAAREKLNIAYKLNRFAAAFFHQSLQKQRHIDEYVRKRGISSELVRNFYLGAAPAQWDALAAHLVAKKAPLPLAVELGLVRPSNKKNQAEGPGFFDLFRNRAMFPILNLRGKVVGFGGRSLPLPPGAPEVGGESPKYLNSPDSLIFQKGRVVYGLYQAQKHIREKDEILLVEGYFDVLGLHAAGFEHAVATCGTAITQDHLNLFKRLGNKTTILFDGDQAGIDATERAMEIGLENGVILYGATMPLGMDPDELLFDSETGSAVPDGKEKMQSILSEAKPLLDARIDEAIRTSTQGPEAKTQAVKKIAGWLAKFKGPVGREIRIQTTVEGLGVSRQLLESAMGPVTNRSGAQQLTPMGSIMPNISRVNSPQPQQSRQFGGYSGGTGAAAGRFARPPIQPRRNVPQQKKMSRSEEIMLAGLAFGDRYSLAYSDARANLPTNMTLVDLFEYAPAKEFVELILEKPGGVEHPQFALEEALRGEVDAQVRSTITEALLDEEPRFTEADLRNVLNRKVARTWARFSQQIKKALAEAETKEDAGLQSELMKEYLDVQRKMKEFTSFYDEA